MFLPENFEHKLVITLADDLLHEVSGITSKNAYLLTSHLQAIDTLLLGQEREIDSLREEKQTLASEMAEQRDQFAWLMTRREMEDLEQFAHQLTHQQHPLADLLSRLATHIPPVE